MWSNGRFPETGEAAVVVCMLTLQRENYKENFPSKAAMRNKETALQPDLQITDGVGLTEVEL